MDDIFCYEDNFSNHKFNSPLELFNNDDFFCFVHSFLNCMARRKKLHYQWFFEYSNEFDVEININLRKRSK